MASPAAPAPESINLEGGSPHRRRPGARKYESGGRMAAPAAPGACEADHGACEADHGAGPKSMNLE